MDLLVNFGVFLISLFVNYYGIGKINKLCNNKFFLKVMLLFEVVLKKSECRLC